MTKALCFFAGEETPVSVLEVYEEKEVPTRTGAGHFQATLHQEFYILIIFIFII
ncbi:hypothetical protein KSD_76280 [Ktedonobacter sp. SOSP1-85]|nr:hypothetical protein KSD_76280 [Ktedonobacter sp. SOSP1-85]